jgi:hypothetical protein
MRVFSAEHFGIKPLFQIKRILFWLGRDYFGTFQHTLFFLMSLLKLYIYTPKDCQESVNKHKHWSTFECATGGSDGAHNLLKPLYYYYLFLVKTT